MKRAISILVLVFIFAFTAQAQRGHKKGMFNKMTPEQKATLRVKKMALKLDLTESQQRQVKAVVKKVIEEKMTKRHQKNKTVSAKKFKNYNDRLDKKIAFKKKMKKILNEKQYEKFEKMAGRKIKKKHHKKKRE